MDDCITLLKRSEQRLLAGNVTAADAAVDLADCFPAVCEQLFGEANFDLAGTGVFISTAIQAASFVIFGTLQSHISQCISPNASPRTKLLVARFQSVFDTIVSTGSFFSLVLVVTCYIRTGQEQVSGLEKSMMRDFLDSHAVLQNLALATLWVQKTPLGIKQSPRSWGCGSSYFVVYGLGVASWLIKKRLDKITAIGAEVAPRLCSSLYDYPHLNSGIAAGGWNPYLVGTGLGLLGIIAAIGLSIALPRLWAWINKVLENRVFLGTFSIIFSLMCCFCVTFEIGHLHFTRKDLEGLPGWNLAQITAVLIWLRPAWHIMLAALRSMSPDLSSKSKDGKKDSSFSLMVLVELNNAFYSSNFEEPTKEEAKPEKSDEEKKQQTLSHLTEKADQAQDDAPPASVQEPDEKARLTDDTDDSHQEPPRSSSPGELV